MTWSHQWSVPQRTRALVLVLVTAALAACEPPTAPSTAAGGGLVHPPLQAGQRALAAEEAGR